jgi:hypothetical protein
MTGRSTARPEHEPTAAAAAAAPAAHRRPASTWLAIGPLAVSLALITFTFASLVAPGSASLPDRPDPASFVAVCSIFVALPAVGALLAIRRPDNPIGWLFLVCGVGFTYGIFATEYVSRATVLGAPLPGVALVDWVGAWSGTLSITIAVTLIPLLFPDGRLPGPRWRPVAWMAGVMIVAGVAAEAVRLDGAGYNGRLPNPIGLGGAVGDLAAVVVDLYFPVLAVIGVLSLGSLLVRFRRSGGIERQQLKWFLFAVAYLLGAVVVAVVTTNEAAWYATMFGLASLPVAAGVAVLRYRLYDIDRIISRTVSYAVVTGILAAVFVGAVIVFQTILAPALGRNPVGVAASTLIVVALFQPLRRRVQRVVDRHFDRARYDAELTVQAFSVRLRDDVDLASLEAETRSVVQRTVAPTTVALWIRQPGPVASRTMSSPATRNGFQTREA